MPPRVPFRSVLRRLPAPQFQRRRFGGVTNTAPEDESSWGIKDVFSGIQPTGVPHIGNYFGALKTWKELQDQADDPSIPPFERPSLFFSIVDLHALTGNTPPEERYRLRKESYAALLAIGLDPEKSTLFFQSDVPQHAELMWILSTIASTGYLSRMTQWKSKLNLADTTRLIDDAATQKLKLGLFAYPVLQAADILLYRASIVPVGEDQRQHIEFARTLARSFNAQFSPTDDPHDQIFKVPEPMIGAARRVMSLRNPERKMSKSDPYSWSQILITDTHGEIIEKLRHAQTDSIEGISYDPVTRPGVSNLIEILKHVTGSELSCEEIAKEHTSLHKAHLKKLVADETYKALEGIRDRFQELMDPSNSYLHTVAFDGARKARGRAHQVMEKVRGALGMLTMRYPALDQEHPSFHRVDLETGDDISTPLDDTEHSDAVLKRASDTTSNEVRPQAASQRGAHQSSQVKDLNEGPTSTQLPESENDRRPRENINHKKLTKSPAPRMPRDSRLEAETQKALENLALHRRSGEH